MSATLHDWSPPLRVTAQQEEQLRGWENSEDDVSVMVQEVFESQGCSSVNSHLIADIITQVSNVMFGEEVERESAIWGVTEAAVCVGQNSVVRWFAACLGLDFEALNEMISSGTRDGGLSGDFGFELPESPITFEEFKTHHDDALVSAREFKQEMEQLFSSKNTQPVVSEKGDSNV